MENGANLILNSDPKPAISLLLCSKLKTSKRARGRKNDTANIVKYTFAGDENYGDFEVSEEGL